MEPAQSMPAIGAADPTRRVEDPEEQHEPNENNSSTSPTAAEAVAVAAKAALADYLVKNPISPSPPPSVGEHEDGILAEPKEKRASLEAALLHGDDNCYGELILLGYNGSADNSSVRSTTPNNQQQKKHRSKMVFRRRDAVGNGIKKGRVMETSMPPRQSKVVQDSTRHVVSYTYHKSRTVLVEYAPDPSRDMFQIGRSSEDQIDFTIVDTWLANGSHPNQQHCVAGNSPHLPAIVPFPPSAYRAPHAMLPHHVQPYLVEHHHSPVGGHRPSPQQQRPISSTISRYACRILADRQAPPGKVYVFAAGFDTSNNIFLGEKATKWQKDDGEYDGFTTNGVLVLHPNGPDDGHDVAGGVDGGKGMYVWREVTVDGDIYSLRESRSSTKRGTLLPSETNQLQDGTLIDLCGATLLWRSAAGLRQSPSRQELERQLDELNAGKPQCPVNLNTLVIPRRRSVKSYQSSRQPYAYLKCGHVQGKHNWGIVTRPPNPLLDECSPGTSYRCPICMMNSERQLVLTMGMEPAFHLDSGQLDYAFNPCGHVASLATVKYWSKIPLPHGTSSFHPCCPFCTSLLAEPPYIRLIYQDHCFDN